MVTERLMSEMICHQRPLILREDATVAKACKQMHERQVGAVMVSGADGHLHGIVAGRDAAHMLVQRRIPDGLLEAVMTRSPDVMLPGHTAIDAPRLMQDGGFRHLPVMGT